MRNHEPYTFDVDPALADLPATKVAQAAGPSGVFNHLPASPVAQAAGDQQALGGGYPVAQAAGASARRLCPHPDPLGRLQGRRARHRRRRISVPGYSIFGGCLLEHISLGWGKCGGGGCVAPRAFVTARRLSLNGRRWEWRLQ